MHNAKPNILITAAHENNLKHIDLTLPLNQITTIIGVSGSGKSSLIYNVLAKEAQRREKIASGHATCRDYAIRPKFQQIDNLPECVVIKQRGLQASITSTLATVTNLHERIREAFIQHGKIICQCGTHITQPTLTDIVRLVEKHYHNKRLEVFAMVTDKKYSDCTSDIRLLKTQGVQEVVHISSYDDKLKTKKVKTLKPFNANYAHTLKIPVGTFKGSKQLYTCLQTYTPLAQEGFALHVGDTTYHFKHDYFCADCHLFYHPIRNSLLSFNAASGDNGQCTTCQGHGRMMTVDYSALIQPGKTLQQPFLNLPHNGRCYKYILLCDDHFEKLCKQHKINRNQTYAELSHNAQQWVRVEIEKKLLKHANKPAIAKFITEAACPTCQGTRLNAKANAVYYHGQNISELLAKTVDEAVLFFEKIPDPPTKLLNILHQLQIATVGYLSLARATDTLSGGELQRIKVASQLNTQHNQLLYILDEPSIGLHAHDNQKFIRLIQALRDRQNTVIISEHNSAYRQHADYLVELGPGSGIHGGNVIFSDAAERYAITQPSIQRIHQTLDTQSAITLTGVTCNNINNENFTIPLGGVVAITGVSGSGKSSLIHAVLVPTLKQYLVDGTINMRLLKHAEHLDQIETMVAVNQSQIGLNARSILATYMGFFDALRDLFTQSPTAAMLDLNKAHFSFNTPDGQCEFCQGIGEIDQTTCPGCLGKRYNHTVLEAKHEALSIADVLDLTVAQAYSLFEKHAFLAFCLQTLSKLGLDHLTLGRPTPTLSGGEAQRLKLAKSLLDGKDKIRRGKCLYVLDEPTAGLSQKDIGRLFELFDEIVQHNNTIIIIEHNLDIVRNSDFIIDLGPGAGAKGGKHVFSGTYTELLQHKNSLTAQALRDESLPSNEIFLSDEPVQPKVYSATKAQPDCPELYLTGKNFAFEEQFAQQYQIKSDGKGFTFFRSKSELLQAVAEAQYECIMFNPFTVELANYEKVALTEIKNRIKKLLALGFEAFYHAGQQAPLKNAIKYINKTLKMRGHFDVWQFRVLADTAEKAYTFGSGWLSVVHKDVLLEYATRAISVSQHMIGTPVVTPATFNRYLNACVSCNGAGYLEAYDSATIILNPASTLVDTDFFHSHIAEKLKSFMRTHIKPALKRFAEEQLFDFSVPFSTLSALDKQVFLHGLVQKHFAKKAPSKGVIQWAGIYRYIDLICPKMDKTSKTLIVDSVHKEICPFCDGTGFKPEIRLYTVNNRPFTEFLAVSSAQD